MYNEDFAFDKYSYQNTNNIPHLNQVMPPNRTKR